MSIVKCDNKKCKYYDNQACTCYTVYYIDRLCMSYKRRPDENYTKLMEAPVPNSCHRERGKYVANTGKTLK